jgi:hypothetical protein
MSAGLGLVVGLTGAGAGGVAGGVQGPGDLGVGQAGLAGGVGELAQVGGGVSVQGAVGGPEQACVAVAFGLGGDPAGQMFQVRMRVLLPKTSSMLVGGDVRVGPTLFAIAIGGALVRRGTLWHGDRPCCCDWPISV